MNKSKRIRYVSKGRLAVIFTIAICIILSYTFAFYSHSNSQIEQQCIETPVPTPKVIIKEVVKEVIKIVPKHDEADEAILKIYNEKLQKKKAITIYLEKKKASDDLMRLIPLIVELSYFHDVDPFRATAIIVHETGFGKSKAFNEKNNVAGMNWTREQKRKIGIRSNIYNLAIEKTKEASVINLITLLVRYKGFTPSLVTLTDIQTKYAPVSDSRNNMNGVDNNEWLSHTKLYYKNINNIYLSLKEGE